MIADRKLATVAADPPVKKCACGGRMVPMTDGNGGVADKCAACGSRSGDGKPPALNGVTIRVRTCTVDGCPGVIGADGNCPCCARRAKWQEANMPKRKCEICEGTIGGGNGRTKYCRACAPIAQKVQTANHKKS